MQRLLGLSLLPGADFPVRGDGAVALGDVGSCVFNIVAILGIRAAVTAVAVTTDFLRLEMRAMLAFLCGRGA